MAKKIRYRTKPKTLPPVHPGVVLREEFMRPMSISINALALHLHVPLSRVSKIVNEERAITADTALRMARYFGTTAEFWLNLQSRYDLLMARDNFKAVEREVQVRPTLLTVSGNA